MASPTRPRGRSPAGKVDDKKHDGSGGSGTKTPPLAPSPSCSPPRRSRTRDARRSRTRDARRPWERVIEHIIKEGGGSANWPQLMKTNYNEWSLRMKLKMQAHHLWDTVEYNDVEFDDDHNALDAICSAVSAEMVPTLVTKLTMKEA